MADKGATTGDAINHAVDKASEGLAQITAALSKGAPKAWELLARATFAEGIASMVIGSFCLIALCIVAFIIIKIAKKIETIPLKREWDDHFGHYMALAVPSAIISVALIAGMVSTIFNSAVWVRVISPEGYLAQQILSKAL